MTDTEKLKRYDIRYCEFDSDEYADKLDKLERVTMYLASEADALIAKLKREHEAMRLSNDAWKAQLDSLREEIESLKSAFNDRVRVIEMQNADKVQLRSALLAAEGRVKEIRQATIKECWDAINVHIQRGHLQGNGCDQTAQRNGMILATNLLAALESGEGK